MANNPPPLHTIRAQVVFENHHVSVIKITKLVTSPEDGTQESISHKVLFAGDPAFEVTFPPPNDD